MAWTIGDINTSESERGYILPMFIPICMTKKWEFLREAFCLSLVGIVKINIITSCIC